MSTPRQKPPDLRIRRTRRLLEQAFASLITEKNFSDITIQEIADRAMVNRGTFYDHFSDKHALMEYALREWYRRLLAEKLPAGLPFSAENLRLLILTTCEFLGDLRSHCLVVQAQEYPASLQTQITTVIAEVLTPWARELHGPDREDDADLAAAVSSWAIYGAAQHWSQSRRGETLAGFVGHALPVILSGFGWHVMHGERRSA